MTATSLTSAVVRRLMLVALLVATLLGLAGCSERAGAMSRPDSTAPPAVAEGEVLVKSIAFTPKEVRTPVGKPVTWRFDDGGLEHTVTADDKLVRLRPHVVGDLRPHLQRRRQRQRTTARSTPG